MTTAPVSRWRNPRFVGVVAAAVLVLLALVAAAVTYIPFGQHSYTAEFASSGGLKSGDEVRVAGVNLGKVRSVELKGDHVEVGFTIKDGVHLGADTRAEVKLATLLGNKYLAVAPEGLGSLNDDTIPVKHTVVTFDVQQAIQEGGSALGKLDAHTIERALRTLSSAYSHTSPGVRTTLDGLGAVSRQLATRRDQLESLVTGASQLVGVLQSRSGDIVKLMGSSNLLLREVVARRQALNRLITGTRSMALQLSGLVRDHAAGIRPFLRRLITVTSLLRGRSAAVDRALKAIGPAGRYYANMTGNGPFIDVQAPYVAPDNVLCRTGVIKDCR